MAFAPAFLYEPVSDDSVAIWPWPGDGSNCHCVTLRFDTDKDCGGRVPPLPPHLMRAVPRRKAEFIAGRRCAAEAIRYVTGRAAFPGMGEDRAPVWPGGVVGSISHTGDRAIALAGSSERLCGLGIDIERLLDEEEARDIAPQVLTANERDSFGDDMDPFMTVLIFSAKESLFKALYPTVKRHFYFGAAELCEFSVDGIGSLRLTCDLTRKWRMGTNIPFQFCLFEDFVLTRVIIPNSG